MSIRNDLIKNREIRFTRYGVKQTNDQSGVDQASKAMRLLSEVGGIEEMTVTTSNILQISYDVRHLTLQMLETALIEVGFNLDISVTMQIKRSLYAYCEEAQRSSLGLEQKKSESTSISLPDNGTHDPRPDNWRHYV